MELRDAINTKLIGCEIHYFENIDSTNSKAKELAESGGREGICVIAGRQEDGRGRLGRAWFSPKGGLWLSILLRPNNEYESAFSFTAMAGVAAANTVRKVTDLNTMLKWPNDVLIDGKKVCGILTESIIKGKELKYMIIGIGMNVNFNLDALPSDIHENSTTLMHEVGHDVSILDLISNLLTEVEEYYEALNKGKISKIHEDWKQSSATLGRRVRVWDGANVIEGNAQDIDESGALIVVDDNGLRHRLISGDCTLVHDNI
jgi:BirA family biotin operon repressor/biotin-[acetyl-CoA-carboxylase] ligase